MQLPAEPDNNSNGVIIFAFLSNVSAELGFCSKCHIPCSGTLRWRNPVVFFPKVCNFLLFLSDLKHLKASVLRFIL